MLRDTILEHSSPLRERRNYRQKWYYVVLCQVVGHAHFFFISSFPLFFLLYPTISLCTQTKPERDLTPTTLLISKADSLFIHFQVSFPPTPICHFLPSHSGCLLHLSTWNKALTGCLSVLSCGCDKISCCKQFNGERICNGSQFKGTAQQGRKFKEEGRR